MKNSFRPGPFEKLQLILSRFIENPDESVLAETSSENPWFIRNFILRAITGINCYLNPKNLNSWVSNYDFNHTDENNIGIIMAGNIPLAGFHDLLCVLISGNNAIVKPSHLDRVMTEYIIHCLCEIEPAFKKRIITVDHLPGIDALIASGSDNTCRHLKYFYKGIPQIIRPTRTSCCVLNGHESEFDLKMLSDDVFLYFGFGCRNVSKIYIPGGYNIKDLISSFNNYEWIIGHKKYYHNYIHNKSLLEMNNEKFIDGGYFTFFENVQLGSPVSVVNYEFYDSENDLAESISLNRGKIQCVVSGDRHGFNPVEFGKAQFPMPWDYAELFLWRQWAIVEATKKIRFMYETVKAVDDSRPLISHVGQCSIIQDIAWSGSDDLENAKVVDFFGTSLPTAIPAASSRRTRRGYSPTRSPMTKNVARACRRSSSDRIRGV